VQWLELPHVAQPYKVLFFPTSHFLPQTNENERGYMVAQRTCPRETLLPMANGSKFPKKTCQIPQGIVFPRGT